MKYQVPVRVTCIVLSLALAACGRGSVTSPPSGALILNVQANSAAASWLMKSAGMFNGLGLRTKTGRVVWADVSSVESGAAVATMVTKARPDLWVPDSQVWADLAALNGIKMFQGDCVDTALSPLVIAMHKPIADALGYPARSLGWLDLGSLAGDASAWQYYSGGQFGKTLRFAHAHPGISGSGASALLAVVQAAKQQQQPVTAADIKQPVVQASLSAFESNIALFGSSTEQLAGVMVSRSIEYLGAAVLYESSIAAMGRDSDIVPVYPLEGTFMATHPACVNSAATAETQEAAVLFRTWLLGDKGQTLAAAAGFRPVSQSIKPIALTPDRGFDLAMPKLVLAPPAADSIVALQESWKAARKPINLVMVLDVSGSMAGAKITGMRSAAAQFVEQLANDDQLTLISFSTNINTLITAQRIETIRTTASSTIRGLQAGGNTALYDAVAAGQDAIKKTNSPRRTNIIVFLTDGNDTSSKSWKFDQKLLDYAKQNSTSVYTIGYGTDADFDKLNSIAQATNGSYYAGDAANIAAIYQDMSTAFGGGGGIGR